MKKSRLRSLSPKRQAEGARSTLTRKAPVKPSNRKRRQTEFVRCYGSKERVAWIAARPCVVACGQDGPCENAHVGRVGAGAGRKGDASQIAPMHPSCHAELHRIGRFSFEVLHSCDLQALADYTEAEWQMARAATLTGERT